jgi:hypothetical protein
MPVKFRSNYHLDFLMNNMFRCFHSFSHTSAVNRKEISGGHISLIGKFQNQGLGATTERFSSVLSLEQSIITTSDR